MAPKNSAPERTAPVNVDPARSLGLAAAFDGIYWLFGGRVENWAVTEDGLVAEGFSVAAKYDPERILTDVNTHVRRAQLWPTLKWITGMVPDHFANPQAITTYMVQFFKGAEEAGTSKSPAYVREAAADYKVTRGGDFAAKRGPRPKSIPLKNLSEVNESILMGSGVKSEDIQHLIEIAQKALVQKQSEVPAATNATATEVAAS